VTNQATCDSFGRITAVTLSSDDHIRQTIEGGVMYNKQNLTRIKEGPASAPPVSPP